MKKNTFFLLTAATVLGVASTALLNTNLDFAAVFGTHDTHSGNHYAAKAPTATESGYNEFWVCCTCHEVFLEQPTGEFVDGTDATMVGGVDATHKAYVPSEMEMLATELATVDSYTGHTYYADSGTYEFDIFKGEKNLIQTNATVAAAAETFYQTVIDNLGNEGQVMAAFATLEAIVVEEYAKDVVTQLKDVLITIFGAVNNGVLGTSVLANGGYHINCGIGAYATWVAVDPTNAAWGSADNRFWIPEAYKASSIIAYAESIANTLTSIYEIDSTLNALMVDAARAAGQFIIEAEMYYAYATNGCLSFNGDKNCNEWWFAWTYANTTGLVNVSANPGYDASTCTNYRLCGALYNPAHEAFSTDLAGVIQMANWVIANQIDDMF